jgi:hypothetical protein
MIAAKAVMDSLLKDAGDVEPLTELSRFRADFHACLTARADELCELADGAPRGAVVPDGGERPSISPPS